MTIGKGTRPDVLGERNPAKRPDVRAKIAASKRGALNPTKRPEVRAKLANGTKLAAARRKAATGAAYHEKRCPSCKTIKPLTDFYKNSAGYCKPCHMTKTTAYQKTNKDKASKWYRTSMLRREYGLELSDYHALLERQAHVCAICRSAPRDETLAVDHDHSTGRVRGLLCFRCNAVLGKMNDDPVLVARMLEYLTGNLDSAHPYKSTPP